MATRYVITEYADLAPRAPVSSQTRPAAKSATVLSTATGVVFTLSRLLGSTSQLALVTGSSANLSLDAATGAISATAPLGVGVSQKALVRENVGDVAVEYPVTITGAISIVTPTVSISAAQSKNEGNSGTTSFVYTVMRSVSTGAVSVPWSFTANTTSANDFVGGSYPQGGTVELADGVSSGTFSVSVSGDTTVEPDESFSVSIVTPAGYAAGGTTTATGTILNDDVAPTPTVTISAAQSKSEGNSGATLFSYTVTRSASSGAVAVPWSFTSGTTSADDFTAGTYPAGGTVNMADGVATGTFSVSVNGDTVVEGDETFTVFISTPSGYLAGAATSATGTLLNDDVAPSPSLTISAAQSKSEGNSGATLFTYTVTRSASSGAVAVPWSFTSGTTSADDFTGGTYPAGGTVNMADGVATGTFSVSVNGDNVVEGDETFTVFISTPSGYVAGTSTSATGTILNDDIAALKQQFVGNRGTWQYNPRSATTAANNLHISRFTDKFGAGGTSGATISDVAFTFTTLYSNDVAGAGYIVRADIEINGICVPFTWGGQPSKTLVSGDNDVACDPLLPSQFGLTAFTQGMAYAGKIEKEFAVGVVPIDCGPNTDIAGESCYRAAAGTASRIGIAGPLGGVTGYTLAYIAHYPVGIIGRVSGGTLPAYASYGASIEAGQNDSLGYCTRASQLGPQIAYSRLALGSELAINFAALNSKRIVFAKYANIASNGYGGNDFSAAKTKEAIATAIAQINAQIKAMGVKRIIQTRLSPKSNTTDDFVTVENQTPKPNFLDTRAYVDAQAALDPNVNILNDMSSAMEPSSKPGVYVVNGTAKWPTLDGVHPESVIHIAMAPVLRGNINTQIAAL